MLDEQGVLDVMKNDLYSANRRIARLEAMLEKKLDLIRCGIGGNYSGDPYENKLYTEAKELLKEKW